MKNQEEEVLLIEEELVNFAESDYGSAEMASRSHQVVLEWRNISVSAKPPRGWLPRTSKQAPNHRILFNVSGMAQPGSLLAVMGSSGSGKTTLLNALTMRSQSHLMIEGSVLVNGRLISPGQMDAICAYVEQDYLMSSFLTVKEQLTFQALLRMDNAISHSNKLKRVDEIIRELGLTKSQDVLIGIPGRTQGISGGERRRLAFASEILTDPPLMLCDEPTSGLDAAMAQNVVSLLRKMAAKGKTVVCTVHQPSSYQFAMFDRILLMARGELAFLGSAAEALAFFSRLHYPCPLNYNPADHFIHVLAGMNGGAGEDQTNAVTRICQAYSTSVEAKSILTRKPPRSGLDGDLLRKKQELKTITFQSSVGTQLRLVMWRSWLCVARNRTHLIARTMESLCLAIFFSLIYRDQHIDQVGIFNINGLYTSIACMMSFQCIFSVVLTNSNDLPIFLRDHWNGMYRTGVYVICKSLAEVPSTVFFPLLMSFLPFYMSGFINGKELLLLCVILILLAVSSASFGNFVTSITSSLGEAMVLIPILASPLLMTSGFFISLRSMPVYIQWFQHISWYKYVNEALSINQWKDVKHIGCNFSNSTCPKDGRAILDVKDFDPNNLLLALTALGIITLSYILLEWTALSFRAWRKK